MVNTEKPMAKAEEKKIKPAGAMKEVKQQATTLPKNSQEKKPEKPTEKKQEEKETEKPKTKKPVVKKSEAVVRGISLPISTKYSSAVCRFIKKKNIQKALRDLEQVIGMKKAVPVKGEIAHKKSVKGKASGSGKYPQNVARQFIKLLKSLQANSNANGLENPVIVEAIANIASRPYGRFGRIRRKRTHVRIKVKELKQGEKKWKKEK